MTTTTTTTTTTDPMADRRRGRPTVSAAEHAAIVAAAAAMIGRTFRYRGGAEFSVLGVNDCRPAHNGPASTAPTATSGPMAAGDHLQNGSTWVADLAPRWPMTTTTTTTDPDRA